MIEGSGRGEYMLIERAPTLEEYRRLRAAVGWDYGEPEAQERGLRGGLYSVCVVHEGAVVGCGRVVGDGGIYYHVQDIIVLPKYQGQGLGKRIMEAVMGYLDGHAQRGAFIALLATAGKAPFYERFGFVVRPPERPGMWFIKE